MRILQTTWGDFILNNAVKLDVYRAREGNQWMVFIAVDSFKHPLHAFESERDSLIFADLVLTELRGFLTLNGGVANDTKILRNICKAALQEVMEQGAVE